MRENIIFYTGSQLKMLVAIEVERRKFWSNYVNMQFDHYFPVRHYIRVDSKVASLKSRLLISISVVRDMRCVCIF